MSYTLAKVAAISGGTAAAGGGIAVGASALSEAASPKQEKVSISLEKTSNVEPEVVPTPQSEPASTKEPVCNVYLAEEPTPKGKTGSRKFTKFKEEFWSRDEFLKKVGEQNLWNKNNLNTEVGQGCTNHGRVFVWWGKGNPSQSETYVYASDMNNGKDWLKESGIDVPEKIKQQIQTL
ncbi:hypothetical protein MHF_1127 [Mycoplasma haemofelis Ohio2]|uniref:Uncharacterized protein n=1 Tax=Mycoplasma haemofelis (strain Ohio2) TaxID=859194 RepID=F6FJL5_MYCHI|nr:hypothetical protein MHF_1127 [Mycoplasma haemofelis Ohio2]